MENVNASNISNIIEYTDIDVGGHNDTMSNSFEQRTTQSNAIAPTELCEVDTRAYAVGRSPSSNPPKEHYSAVSVEAPHDSDEEAKTSGPPRSCMLDVHIDKRDKAVSAQPSKEDKGKSCAADPSDVV